MRKFTERKNDLLIIALFVLVVIATFVMAFVQTSAPAEVALGLDTPMQTAFAESNADFVQTTAQDWVKIDDIFHEASILGSYYESLRQVVGDDDLLSFDEYDDDNYAGFSISGVTEQGYEMDLVLQSIGSGDTGNETYLIVDLKDRGAINNIPEIETYIGKLFAAVSCKSEPSIMVEGCYEGIKSKREKKKIAKSIFKAIDGDIEEKITDDGYISFSGYTKAIAASVKSDSHKINFQTALSDNEKEKRTHIYLGTPVVFSDF